MKDLIIDEEERERLAGEESTEPDMVSSVQQEHNRFNMFKKLISDDHYIHHDNIFVVQTSGRATQIISMGPKNCLPIWVKPSSLLPFDVIHLVLDWSFQLQLAENPQVLFFQVFPAHRNPASLSAVTVEGNWLFSNCSERKGRWAEGREGWTGEVKVEEGRCSEKTTFLTSSSLWRAASPRWRHDIVVTSQTQLQC